jgi:hypothetical protein
VSYDLLIRSDVDSRGTVTLASIVDVIAALPDVRQNGPRAENWLFERGTDHYAEIDVDLADAEANCIWLHIPYAFLRDGQLAVYVSLAETIAERLGWAVHDPQPPDAIARAPKDWADAEASADPAQLAFVYRDLGLHEDADRILAKRR